MSVEKGLSMPARVQSTGFCGKNDDEETIIRVFSLEILQAWRFFFFFLRFSENNNHFGNKNENNSLENI